MLGSSRTIPPNAMFRPRSHLHACGHYCCCHLEHYAKTTDCRKCRAWRFNEQAKRDEANEV